MVLVVLAFFRTNFKENPEGHFLFYMLQCYQLLEPNSLETLIQIVEVYSNSFYLCKDKLDSDYLIVFIKCLSITHCLVITFIKNPYLFFCASKSLYSYNSFLYKDLKIILFKIFFYMLK